MQREAVLKKLTEINAIKRKKNVSISLLQKYKRLRLRTINRKN